MLIKLSVLGCTRLSIEAILNSLKALKSMGTQGVKHLRVGWLFGVTCGQCINDSEYEESFSLEYLCSDCCKLELAKCHERPDRIIGPSSPEAGNLRLHG
ncbi:hypothetical protein V6N13_005302 [Hibiscus sabdariffa]